MSNFHVNTETGEVGECHAKIKCRFASKENVEHFESAGEALKKVEEVLSEKHGQFKRKKKPKSEKYMDGQYKGTVPAPEYNVSELAYVATDMDIDKANYKLAMSRDLLSVDEKLAFFKNPNDSELKNLVQDRINRNVSDQQYTQMIQESTLENYMLKADMVDAKIAPEMAAHHKQIWNDTIYFLGKKSTREQFKVNADKIQEFENRERAGEEISDDEKERIVWNYIGRHNAKNALDTDGLSHDVLVSQAGNEARKEITEKINKPALKDYGTAKERAIELLKKEDGNYSWANHMGDRERTPDSEKEYKEKIEANITKDKRYKEYFNEYVEREVNADFFARRYEVGYATNHSGAAGDIESAFEENWVMGGGESEAKERHANAVEKRENFRKDIEETGGLDAGNNKQIRTKLDKDVEYAERIIKTRGRSDRGLIKSFQEDRLISPHYRI